MRRQDQCDLWKEITYVVFDAPALEQGFEERLAFVQESLRQTKPRYARAHEHLVCAGLDSLKQELARLEALGAEGLMLRRPGSRYESGRSATLLKVKSFQDAEARVVGHQAGAGRHKGRLGALLVELPDGTPFAVGTGFSDAERGAPPPVGSTITFRYQELSEGGVPRFPSYLGVRLDAEVVALKTEAAAPSTKVAAGSRRFELVEGTAQKFWALQVHGSEVTVQYGRIGTAGQTQTKSFRDEAEATKHAAKLIGEKTDKGYREVT